MIGPQRCLIDYNTSRRRLPQRYGALPLRAAARSAGGLSKLVSATLAKHTWPHAVLATMIIGGPIVAVGAAELGAAGASRDAEAMVSRLLAAGRYPEAIAVDRALADRTGPLHLLSRGPVDRAAVESQSILIDWAGAIASHGDVDGALSALTGVTRDDLVDRAARQRATILLASARRAAAARDFPAAVSRLSQLRDPAAPAAATTAADQLRPAYEVGAAPQIARDGRAADAVTLLDDAISHAQGGTIGDEARSLLPATLLMAAHQSLDAQYRREAQSLLLRLQYDFASSKEARTARVLLQAPQPVAGTLASKNGKAVVVAVRLSGHFRTVGTGYLTSPPFYLDRATESGDFTFKDVPPGGPYVLEVFSGGQWTTSIDPGSGRPANSFMVDQMVPVDLGFVTVPS